MTRGPGRPFAAASLAALTHPISLAAIAVLLLNDHLLKHAVPSTLTGKLSDFAGLYFAPYVSLAVVFAVLSVRRRSWPGHAIAAATYCAIGLLFTVLKTSADASDIFITAVSAMTGVRISFVTDPSDLLALSSMPVSFALWARQLPREPLERSRARLSLRAVALSLAGIAIVATSSPPAPSVTSIAADQIDGGRMYAVVEYAGDRDGVYLSTDDGANWSRATTSTGALVADPREAGVLYLIDSASKSGLLRMRIPGGPPEEIGPYAKGAGFTDTFGLTYLRIGAALAGALLRPRWSPQKRGNPSGRRFR
jgi:hypothetical protein